MRVRKIKIHTASPLSLQEEFVPSAPLRGRFAAGAVARAVVELVVEPVETRSRHRVAPGGGGGAVP